MGEFGRNLLDSGSFEMAFEATVSWYIGKFLPFLLTQVLSNDQIITALLNIVFATILGAVVAGIKWRLNTPSSRS